MILFELNALPSLFAIEDQTQLGQTGKECVLRSFP